MEQVYKETMKMTKSSGMYKTKYYNIIIEVRSPHMRELKKVKVIRNPRKVSPIGINTMS